MEENKAMKNIQEELRKEYNRGIETEKLTLRQELEAEKTAFRR